MDGISKVWPKWQAMEVLGEGGFGKVYKAKRESFGEVMYSAIKVVKIPNNPSEIKEMSTSGLTQANIRDYYYNSVKSMIDEVKMMEHLKSAGNIVGIEDFECVEYESGIGWTIYIRMELLTNILDYYKQVQITEQEVCKMALHILKALEYCHQQNIIHRDIKPANIFVSKFGEYKLGDFGVSREAEKSMATMSQKGTKSYMAPEMVRMEKYGKNVDLYALGLTMYELLNRGRMPFLPPWPEPYYPQDREEATVQRLLGKTFPDIEGVGKLNQIIQKACDFNPNLRYQTPMEMRKAILDLGILDEYTTSVSKENTDEHMSIDTMVESTEDPEEEFTNNDINESTIGMFGGNSIFNQKEEVNDDLEKKMFDYLIATFKRQENIDLNRDQLAVGRIKDVISKKINEYKQNGKVFIDIPYITASSNGVLHIHQMISKAELEGSDKKENKTQNLGWLFGEEEREIQNYQITCPHCKKTAYLQASNVYYCPSCDRMHQTKKDDQTAQVSHWTYQYLHKQTAQERITLIRQIHQFDPDNAQVNIKLGQTIGNLGNAKEQFTYYQRALELDPYDATVQNNNGVWYLLNTKDRAFFDHLKKAVEYAKKNQDSSWNNIGVIHANFALANQTVGMDKDAFNHLVKAYHHGYANCDLQIQNNRLGGAYCERVVTQVLDAYRGKLSKNCQFNVKPGFKKFGAYDSAKFLMNCDPALIGQSMYGIAFGDTALHYYGKKSDGVVVNAFGKQQNWYMGYYMLCDCRFDVEGSKKIKITLKQQSAISNFVIEVGKDAPLIVEILKKIQFQLKK